MPEDASDDGFFGPSSVAWQVSADLSSPVAGLRALLITEPIEDSTARLVAKTNAVSTGSTVLDRLLAGPGFLDAGSFPEVSFRSGRLVWTAGWRAIGRLQVKGIDHELACLLDLQGGDPHESDGPRIVISSS